MRVCVCACVRANICSAVTGFSTVSPDTWLCKCLCVCVCVCVCVCAQVAGLQSALEQLYVSKIGREQLTQFQQMMTELTAQPTSRAAQPQPQRTQQHKSPTHKHASPQRAHTVRSIPNHPNQQQPASDEVTDKLASARPVQAVGPATLQLRPARVPHIQLTQPAAAHAVCSQSQLGRLGCLTDTAGSPPVATMPCSPGRNEGLEIGQVVMAG